MKTIVQYPISGEAFGARGCSSCSCSPCDCNPCQCGSSQLPSYPDWRVSGFVISNGVIDTVDVSQLVILGLSRPVNPNQHATWQEIILISDTATPQQINTILAAFERVLHSMPAEVVAPPSAHRTVYQTHLVYTSHGDAATLQVDFTFRNAKMVRAGDGIISWQPWTYTGPMAIRGQFDTQR
ncbi:DUF1326 domain-containing protein [Dictyobacter arantiisoli]|uniref:DUF1326 domain-containing protein n=1 Tax=Dictyobacter arantiisoli TaxID=2014874 RepID=A0A5A5T5V1_9CHLR|nr:DUF1326 domain-containing protein [Dictyobacter arantiisoli]GCF06810.1 hypothetical protein KDI_03740 [Dictyobacter arantiisoli]